jgi:exodeoxyribonuclease VII small subunit
MNIEKKVAALEKITSSLEGENINLDKAVEKYEEALVLAKDVFTHLQKTEKRIILLQKDADKIAQNLEEE